MRNADNEGLGAWGNKIAGIVGHVSEVNGSEACEVPEFVPTKHELVQLAKYWFNEYFDTSFWCWAQEQSGSTEWRMIVFSGRRLDRIAEVLPEFDEIFKEAQIEFRQKHNITDEEWDKFKRDAPPAAGAGGEIGKAG